MRQKSSIVLIFSLLSASVAPDLALAQSTARPDLSKQPTLYTVGYAHLDTEWRWEYPQVIDEYLRNTMEKNFALFEKYPHYIFNFSGANRYRLMKEYHPEDFAKMKKYIDEGRWFPAGSSMEEGDVNIPSAEAIIRQILYGNNWFRKEFGKASEEYMLPDCFGFPSSLPSILAHSGVKGFSTQKLTWGSSANVGGLQSIEKTPEGTPFNVGVWVGPDGKSVLAAFNPGSYGGGIWSDLSKPLPEEDANPLLAEFEKRMGELQKKMEQNTAKKETPDPKEAQELFALRTARAGLLRAQRERAAQRYQGDWAARVLGNGKASGLFTDYHYYGTGDIGGSPEEESVKRLEAIVSKSVTELPPQGGTPYQRQNRDRGVEVKVGEGPVNVLSATADQMFRDITPEQAAMLPRYTGELELTNHSAGSLTSQAYQKRWIREEELLADAAEKSSVAAAWLGARSYPQQRLNDAWTLAMAAHFHDLAAGTATPKSYEFAWNDAVIAMNQFSGVLSSATQAIAGGMNTQAKGIPVVVYNPLNIVRQGVVEARIDFPGAVPKFVRVTGPDGSVVPSQLSNGKVLFLAQTPSVGFAVYDVQAVDAAEVQASSLRVASNELENAYYRVKLNDAGDVSSIFDKKLGRELLAAPARLAISYDNPEQWPAWNMDWEQEQAAPKSYVSGPAKIRVVEDGPVRVALEVSRETAGSRFVQTVRLATGEAGRSIEFANVIDWATKESNLKATFPLTASNSMATYNWGLGTIERPTAEPKKFEVPTHQWIDLTDQSQKFGATILTGSKYGSDKPTDNTLRLTLLRTPGIKGGYPDEATQDIGHHEFIYGITGHAGDWRASQTDWIGQELNAPLLGFATEKHEGALGRSFSFLKIDNPRIQVMALKKAEDSDETILRLVELDGKPQENVQVAFASSIESAREVNGQEQPIGTATVTDGALVTSFGAYQPRTFALKLASSPTKIKGVRSEPVALRYDLSVASKDGAKTSGGFDGKGNALPAELLPEVIDFHGVVFKLAKTTGDFPNAVAAKGQKIVLPAGNYNKVYLLAAAEGDQKGDFEAGGKTVSLNIQNWGGYIGQWDNRQWSPKDTAHDNYGDMVGLAPGYIKRADLAWYGSHHHDATGKNVAYAYSYLFGYAIDLPAGAEEVKLPKNDKIRILAISVAAENSSVKPVQPLYDELPSANPGIADFTLSAAKGAISVPQGRKASNQLLILPRGSFDKPVTLKASGLPRGLTASFLPESTGTSSQMTLSASNEATPGKVTVTVTASAESLTRSVSIPVEVTPVKKGTVSVDLSHSFNLTGIYKDGSKFDAKESLDGEGGAFAAELLGADQVGNGVVLRIGSPNMPNAVTGRTIDLPFGKFAKITLLATGVEGSQDGQVFTVNYTDGSSSSFTQSLSDWAYSRGFSGESTAVEMQYRLGNDGSHDSQRFHLYAYSFDLSADKTPKSITLPGNRNVVVFAVTLTPVGL